jgi:chromo domain-containing protein 1
LFNGCITAFSDTQGGVSDLEKELLDKDLVGIARICPRPTQPDYGLTLLCYPTKSKNFQFLNKHPYDVPEGSLCVAGRSGVLPRRLQNVVQESRWSAQRYERHEREGRFSEPEKSETGGSIQWRRPSQSTISAPRHDDSSLDAPERPLKIRTEQQDSRIQETMKPQTVQLDSTKISVTEKQINPAADQETDVSMDSDAMDISMDSNVLDTSDSPIRPVQEKPGHSILETPVSEEPSGSPPVDEPSNEITHMKTAEDNQDVPIPDISDSQNIEGFIMDAFPKVFKIDFQEIATITSRSLKTTNCFYLWFPASAEEDFEILEKFLDSHCAIKLSNRKRNDWEKFTRSPSGVALVVPFLHHLFLS